MNCRVFLRPFAAALVMSYAPGAVAQDGALIDREPHPLRDHFAGDIDCFRLTYASDGLRIVGFLLKPKSVSRRLPVLIYNRGGNREFGKIGELLLERELAYLASQNYVVLASQYRGNDGGEGHDDFGGDDVHDVLSLIRLAQTLPFADSERVVMLGDSRGGLMTYLAIKSGARLRAAAVVGAPSDLVESHRERESFARVLEELIGGGPSERQEDYRERSAYFWAEKLTVPLLILHGENDWRVPCSHSKKLAERLELLGAPHRLVVFPDGDHALDDHPVERDRLILEWFEKHLEPPPEAGEPALHH